MMGIRVFSGIVIFSVFSFSTLELGSVTDGSYEIKSSAIVRSPKPKGLDSLVIAFDEYLTHSIDSLKSPGAAIAVVYKGEIILLKGYGVKQAGENDSVNLHTAFRLGSVSKGFASVLTGIMVEEGSLNWDDRVKSYLDDFRMKDTACANHLTVRHILSHTTGFPEHTYTDMLDNGYEYESIKSSLASVPILAKPGVVYGYQNVVYSLIADILYSASGKDYNNLLQEKIFRPLNMRDASTDYTSFYYNPNSAMPHLRMGNAWKVKPKNSRYYSVSPASGVNASASDMAKWLLALTGYYPEILHEKTIHDISSHAIETPRKSIYRKNWKSLDKTYYGLGWRVFNVEGHDLVYHGGYVEGFRSEIAFDPESKIGIAVLFNSNTTVASQCIPKFINSFFENCCPPGQTSLYAEHQ
jgi:beta-lactamase class C